MTARILIILIIIVLLFCDRALGYVSTQVPHDDGIYSDYDLCAMCHTMLYDPGVAGEVDYQFRDSTPEFISYRCVACHIGINTTANLSMLHSGSVHAGVSCTSCHDVYHAGHTFRRGYYYRYDEVQVYGCSDTRACHQVTGNWPSSPLPAGSLAYNFVPVYFVNITAPSSWSITRTLFGYSLTYSTAVYPEAFIKPYTGNVDAVSQTMPTRMCHKCHFTDPQAPITPPQTYQYPHPETCTSCHSNHGDPHGAMESQLSWMQCSACHQTLANLVASSVHSTVACRCHGIVHSSGWNKTASWMPLYYPPSGRLLSGDPTSIDSWRHLFYYSTANYTVFQVPAGPVVLGADYTYVYVAYTLRWDAGPVNQTSRQVTCFNCHFTSWDEQAGAWPVVYLGYAGDPHSIQEQDIDGTGGVGFREPGYGSILAVVVSLLALVVVVAGGRKR